MGLVDAFVYGVVGFIVLGGCLLFVVPILGDLVTLIDDPTGKFFIYAIPIGLVIAFIIGVVKLFRNAGFSGYYVEQ